MEKHICCPTHCCQIHGCKYGYDDCPVATKQKKGMTGSCEDCGLEESGYYGDERTCTHELEMENHKLKEEIEQFKKQQENKTMDKEEFFDALDGLFAYDSGCVDSGIHDELLRKKVKQELKKRESVEQDLLRFFTERLTPDKGYGISDAKAFISWLDDRMDFYV